MRECIEELLRFTLESSVGKTLDFDLGISDDFCSVLLKDDPVDPFSESAGDPSGAPAYPLYKRIAWALWRSLSSGAFCRSYSRVQMIHGESFLKEREKGWLNLIMDKGSEVIKMLKNTALEFQVQEPFFHHLKDGQKTIEGKYANDVYCRITPGTMILLNKCMVFEVQVESVQKILPGVETIEEGMQICRRLNDNEEDGANGVLAFCLSKVAVQPYIYLARLLLELGYEGLQGLLGLTHTIGTVPDVLPPPRSALLSSFMVPRKPEIKGNKLTHGARALAKHSHRSSDKTWGTMNGSDSDKNRMPLDVICDMMAHCCWLNLHIVPPHGVVFEIRVSDGHGARWSKDGNKFIGFLEPYTEDGHSKGWKH